MKTLKLLAPLRTKNNSKNKQFFIYQSYVNMFKKINIDLIFISPSSAESYKQLANICDGLFLAGGVDMDANYYHESNYSTNILEMPEIDQMEIDLIKLFNQINKPIIGICRGHQIINVAFGGTLYQDINNQYNTNINHNQNNQQKYCHYIHIVKNSTLSRYLPEITLVNSYHHQNIKNLAPGFKVMAYSEDGLIEAIEKKNIISVQWHPEKVNDENQNNILTMFSHLFKDLDIK